LREIKIQYGQTLNSLIEVIIKTIASKLKEQLFSRNSVLDKI